LKGKFISSVPLCEMSFNSIISMVISSSRLAISSLCRLRRLPAYCHLMCRRWYTRLYAGVLASSWGVLPVIATSRSELKPLILCRSVLVSSHPSHPYVIMASRVWSSTRVSHAVHEHSASSYTITDLYAWTCPREIQ
jgi:hypothetical protein